MQVKLHQNKAAVKKLNIDKVSNWILMFPENISQSHPYAPLFKERRKETGSEKTDTSPVVCDLPNKPASHVALACIKEDISSFALLTLARKLVAEHDAYKAKEIGVSVAGFDEAQTERITEAIIAAILTAAAEMPSFKSEKKQSAKLSRIHIFVHTKHVISGL